MLRRNFLQGLIGALTGVPIVIQQGENDIQGVGVLRFPQQDYCDKDGNKTLARDVAANLSSQIKQGTILGLPSTRDENGNYLWDFRIEIGDPGQVKIERISE